MGSAQRSMCAAMLILQAVVLGLTTPVMIGVSQVDVATALWVGLGLTLACILTAGLLKRPWAYLVGWAIQVAAVALGFLLFGVVRVEPAPSDALLALLAALAVVTGRVHVRRSPVPSS